MISHAGVKQVLATALTVALLAVTPGVARASGASPRRVPGMPVHPAPLSQPAPRNGAVPSLPKASAFVTQAYQALFGRYPDRAETSFWGARIAGAGEDVTGAVGQLVNSDEHLLRVLDRVYFQLGRPVEPAGRAYWLDRLRSGLSAEGLTVDVLGSPEYFARSGSTNPAVVKALYEDLFGRPAEPGGLAHWTAELDRGLPLPFLVLALVQSREGAVRAVGQAYRAVLDRPTDSGATDYWGQRFSLGTIGELSLTMALLSSAEAVQTGCDPLVARSCLLPFPNDYFTVPDTESITGRRVALRSSMMPRNASGAAVDPVPSNRSDGFAVGQAGLVFVPGLDLAQTAAAPVTDIARSLDPSAPVLVVDAATGERQPVWAEMDSNAPPSGRPDNQVTYIRPARNYTAGHRYIVVLRNLRNAAGSVIAAPDAFARYRDHASEPGDVDGFERRRPHMEQLFTELGQAGIARPDLFLAWDFTVASTENTTGRLLHIRDDAYRRLGGPAAAPAFTVTSVINNPVPGVARRVQGTFGVPSYLTQDSPGGQFTEGVDGLPYYSGHDLTTTFTCNVPASALTSPGRGVVYGHGLFGGQDEVNSDPQRAMATGFDMVYCATDWLGMASPDISTAFVILQDLSLFPKLADRVQEGVLATLFLGRLLHSPQGFASNQAFQNATTQPVIDTSDVFYDGNSQGAILGGITTAVSPEWTRAVLGVVGMNFTTLVERSVDFDPFNNLLKSTYPDTLERTILLSITQMQWDRSEPDGYAAHLTDRPLANTPAHTVLLHTAVGDHQVATVTADNEARTAGIPAHRPALAPGRSTDVNPLWGIPAIAAYPYNGSALFYWDSGSPLPPVTNTPPRTGHDPHGDPSRSALAQQQKAAFLATNGAVIDPCAGQPCTVPQS